MSVQALLRVIQCGFLPAILVSCLALGQSPGTPAPESLKDPKALLAAVAPSYDFNSPAMKPWHFTASYQLFDAEGRPAENGSFEYWWASPDVYRGTWKRGTLTWTKWHTGGGKEYFQSNGGELHILETEFWRDLLDPLPQSQDISKSGIIERDTVKFGKVKSPCVRIARQTAQATGVGNQVLTQPIGTYCFDRQAPVLIMSSRNDGIVAVYGDFARFAGRYVSRSVVEAVEGRKIFTLAIDSITSLDPADAALVPPPEAQPDKMGVLDYQSGVVPGQLLKHYDPKLPEEGQSGTVVLEVKIGTDGKVKDVQVISGPPSRLVDDAVNSPWCKCGFASRKFSTMHRAYL
jgi:TonB family protein